VRALVSDIAASSQLSRKSAAATLLRVLLHAGRIALADTRIYGWMRARAARSVPRDPSHDLFSADLLAKAGALVTNKEDHILENAQRQSLQRWPLPMYLRIEDRCSMAHSVEARLPFTDYRLVELAMRMPRALKFARGLNKVGLRRAATGRVPGSVISRTSKLGFPVSAGATSLSDLRTVCADLVESRAFAERGIYNLLAARSLLAASSRAVTPAQADAMFKLAQTELWLRATAQGPHRPGS
jgi:hypothetical protein